jgi:PAS domain S-box-containing protein
LNHLINFSGTMSETKIQLLKDHFRNEPPISPYDEIRKRNIQLIELSNKLRESEKQYQMLTDTLPLMMFAINAKGEVTYSNKWLKDFFAEQSQQVSSVSWQSMLHPEDIKEIWRSWDKSQLERTAFKAQARLKNKSEKYVWHLITIVPVINEKNIAASWIGFFVDIHSQKLVEETLKDNKDLKEVQKALEEYQLKLEQTISELKVSNQNLEQFAFIASHDLQEPLRKIKTFANLLESDLQLNEKQNGYFRKIKDSSDRMSNLIRDVLNYSRLSNLEDAFEDTDLNTLMNTVLLDFELLIGEKEAKVTVSRLPTLRVMPLQINQLFSNLLHNALKFSNEKPVVEISSYLLSEQEKSKRPELDAAKNYHCIRFRDNGIGFDPEYSEKIFRIFQRLEESNAGGTGIGLALCRRIMENHKGFITAESPGEGAVFNLVFPSVTEA